MADVLAHEIVTRHRRHLRFSHVAQAMQNLRHAQRHGRLAGSRIAGEGHVQRRRSGDEAELCAGAIDEQQRGDVADPRFQGFETDELAIELVQHVVHLRAREQGAQVDALGRTIESVGLQPAGAWLVHIMSYS